MRETRAGEDLSRPERRTLTDAEIISVILAALWFAVFPLFTDFTYGHITRTKWITSLVLAGLSLAAAVTASLMDHSRLRGMLRDPVVWLGAGLFAWMGLSALLGARHDAVNDSGQLAVWAGSRRYEGMSTQLAYFAVFLSMRAVAPRVREASVAAAAALVCFCAVVAMQYADLNPLGLFPGKLSIRTNYEFQGTIGNIDMVAQYLSLVLPLTLLYWVVRGGRLGVLTLAAGSLGVLLSFMTEVQAGYIALGVLLLVTLGAAIRFPEARARALAVPAVFSAAWAVRRMIALPWLDGGDAVRLAAPGVKELLALLAVPALCAGLAFVLRRHPGRALSAVWAVGVPVLALALCVLLIALLPVPQTAGGLWEIHEVLQGRPQDAFGSYRMAVWRHTLDMSRHNLLLGTGPDTFYYAFADHLAQAGAVLPERFDNPHSLYLTYLANCGLPALLLFLALAGCAAVRLLRRGTGYAVILLGALLCFLAQGVFTFSISITAPMFWAALGMAAGCASDIPDRPHKEVTAP